MISTPERDALERLRAAIDSHEPARVADCFTDDFHAELPHHPERSFTGSESVRANWTGIFAQAPDLSAVVLRAASSGAELWSEWEMTGTDPSGAAVVLVGPVVLTLRDGKFATARFYLDPVAAPTA